LLEVKVRQSSAYIAGVKVRQSSAYIAGVKVSVQYNRDKDIHGNFIGTAI
jgi:hypothetical protein